MSHGTGTTIGGNPATLEITAFGSPDVVEGTRRNIDLNIDRLAESIQCLRTQRNLLAPISKLPPEILSQIFTCCMLTGDAGWIKATHVCRHWRLIALETPSLWSQFYPLKNIEWTKEILSRSKDSPLSVTYVNFDISISSVRLALKQLSRIKSLHVHSVITVIQDLLLRELTTPAPLLESLTVRSALPTSESFRTPPIMQNTIFAATAPRLRKLKLVDCILPRDSPLLDNLTSLELSLQNYGDSFSFTLSELLPILEKLPLLQVLDLSSVIYPISKDTLLRPKVNLPCLEHLQVSAMASIFNDFLGLVDFPPSTILDFHCDSFNPDSSSISNVLSKFTASVNLKPLHRMSLHYTSPYSVTYEAWALTDPGARIHFRLTTASGSPLAPVYTAAANVCSALTLNDLRSLSVGSLDRDCLTKEAWVVAFGNAAQLSTLTLTENPMESFLDVLTPDDNSETVFLPRLHTIILSGVELEDCFASLLDCLMLRWEYHMEIQKLVIEDCSFIGNEEIEELKEIVVDVEWDGFESYLPKEDEEEENEFEDEEFYSDGGSYGIDSDYEDYNGLGFIGF